MPALAAAIEALGLESTWLDGEIVVMSEAGVPDFNALQNAIDSVAGEEIDYFLFDLPFHSGRDLRKLRCARAAPCCARSSRPMAPTGSASARASTRRRRRCSRRRGRWAWRESS